MKREFLYALWRDLVSDPTLICEAVNWGDAAGLHRPLARRRTGLPKDRQGGPFVLVSGLHR